MTTYYNIPLPTKATPNYTYNVDLDGTIYKFNFTFNTRISSWHLSISDIEGILLVSGLKIIPWLDLLIPFTKEVLPLGRLVLAPKSGQYPFSPEITLQNLSTEFVFFYISPN